MILKPNDKNTNVAIWQEFLNLLGYKLTVDKHFGPATERATRSFQAVNNLRADGLVGDQTIAEAKARGFTGFLTSSQTPSTSKGETILVSAGHTNVTGQDRGAAGNGFIEGVLTVELRDAVAEKLLDLGVSVLEDGADGVNDPLKKAIALAKSADVAVEFHWNASANPKATGVEVLAKIKHKQLAQSLAAAISDATGLSRRGNLGYKADNSGQHHRLGFVEAKGVIVEVCFISNPNDMKAYHDNFGRVVKNLADVLAGSIV